MRGGGGERGAWGAGYRALRLFACLRGTYSNACGLEISALVMRVPEVDRFNVVDIRDAEARGVRARPATLRSTRSTRTVCEVLLQEHDFAVTSYDAVTPLQGPPFSLSLSIAAYLSLSMAVFL